MRPTDVVAALSDILWQAGDNKRRADAYIPHGGEKQEVRDAETKANTDELKQEVLTALEGLEKTCVLLPTQRTNVVYIAGPMTGYEEYNFPAFNAVADNLRAQGYTVYNPADHGLIEGAGWADYLRFDLGNLVKCEAIFFLPGWSHSNGAQLEYDVAKRLGMKLSFHPKAEVPDECQASLDIQLT